MALFIIRVLLLQAQQVPLDYVRYTFNELKKVFERSDFANIRIENPTSVSESIDSLMQQPSSYQIIFILM